MSVLSDYEALAGLKSALDVTDADPAIHEMYGNAAAILSTAQSTMTSACLFNAITNQRDHSFLRKSTHTEILELRKVTGKREGEALHAILADGVLRFATALCLRVRVCRSVNLH